MATGDVYRWDMSDFQRFPSGAHSTLDKLKQKSNIL